MLTGVVTVRFSSIIIYKQGSTIFKLVQPSSHRPGAAVELDNCVD